MPSGGNSFRYAAKPSGSFVRAGASLANGNQSSGEVSGTKHRIISCNSDKEQV